MEVVHSGTLGLAFCGECEHVLTCMLNGCVLLGRWKFTWGLYGCWGAGGRTLLDHACCLPLGGLYHPLHSGGWKSENHIPRFSCLSTNERQWWEVARADGKSLSGDGASGSHFPGFVPTAIPSSLPLMFCVKFFCLKCLWWFPFCWLETGWYRSHSLVCFLCSALWF